MRALGASLLVATLLLGVSAPAATSADRRLRSVNGEVLSAPAVAPWNAQLDAGDGICSATIIDLSHVLTAGACVFTGSRPDPPSALTITAGVVRAGPGNDADTVQTRGVSAVAVHPGFGQRRYKLAGVGAEGNFSFAYDLARLTLSAPLQRTAQVAPVALADVPAPPRSIVRIVGFGDPAFGANELPAIARSMTSRITARPTHCADGDPSLLCMVSRRQSPCASDSGAGVVTTGATPVLVGIHSFHDNKCVVNRPSGATSTTEPGIARWLRGDTHPTLAPSTPTRPVIRFYGARRRQLACRGPRWSAATRIRTLFVQDDTQRTLQTGPRVYRPTGATRSRYVYCVSIATNAGGTTEASSSKALRVGTRQR